MAEFTKETVNTNTPSDSSNTVVVTPAREDVVVTTPISARNKATNIQTVEYLIYFFFGLVEILLVFRLLLKLTGASISSAFVGLIYGLTGIFILPFEGIFHRGYAQGIETTSVLEPATIVAIIVYVVLAWGIVKLLRILSGEQRTT